VTCDAETRLVDLEREAAQNAAYHYEMPAYYGQLVVSCAGGEYVYQLRMWTPVQVGVPSVKRWVDLDRSKALMYLRGRVRRLAGVS